MRLEITTNKTATDHYIASHLPATCTNLGLQCTEVSSLSKSDGSL